MTHTFALSTLERTDRRVVRRRADAIEVETRRPQGLEPVAPRAMSRWEWMGAGVLWAFVAAFVVELVL